MGWVEEHMPTGDPGLPIDPATWLRAALPRLTTPATLGILCAGLDVKLAEVAPAHLAFAGRVDALLAHLQAQGDQRLSVLCDALLADEPTLRRAQQLGLGQALSALSTANALSPGKVPEPGQRTGTVQRAPQICHPLATGICPRWAELATLNAYVRAGAHVVLVRGEPGLGKSVVLGQWLASFLDGPAAPAGSTAGSAASAAQAIWQLAAFSGLFYWSFSCEPDLTSFWAALADYVLVDRLPGTGSDPFPNRPSLDSQPAQSLAQRKRALWSALAASTPPILLVLDGLEHWQRGPGLSQPAPQPPDLPGSLHEPALQQLLSHSLLSTRADSGLVLVATVEQSIPWVQPWLGRRCVELPLPPLTDAEAALVAARPWLAEAAPAPVALPPQVSRAQGHPLMVVLLTAQQRLADSPLPPPDVPPLGATPLACLPAALASLCAALSPSASALLLLCVLCPRSLSVGALRRLVLALVEAAHSAQRGPWLVALRPLIETTDPTDPLRPLHPLVSHGLVCCTPATWPPTDSAQIGLHPHVHALLLDQWGLRAALADPERSLLHHLAWICLHTDQPALTLSILHERLAGYPTLLARRDHARWLLSILRALYFSVAPRAMHDLVWQERYGQFLYWEAETLMCLGQLDTALIAAQRQWPLGIPPSPARQAQQARVARLSGQLPSALALATLARQRADDPLALCEIALETAAIYLLLGELSLMDIHLREVAIHLRDRSHPAQPTAPLPLPTDGLHTTWQCLTARRALCLGQLELAAVVLREEPGHPPSPERSLLRAELLRAQRQLPQALAVLTPLLSEDQLPLPLQAAILLSTARLHRELGQLASAKAAAERLLALTTTHHLGIHRIDALLLTGSLQLRSTDTTQAEHDARDALALATDPRCGYRVGEADALHLLAITLLARRPASSPSDQQEALAHLTDELTLREAMGDPTSREVHWQILRLRSGHTAH